MTDYIGEIETALRNMGQNVMIGMNPPDAHFPSAMFTVQFRDHPFSVGQGDTIAAAWADACARIGGRLAA